MCGWVTNPLDMVKTRLMVPVRQATPTLLPCSISVWSAQEPQSSRLSAVGWDQGEGNRAVGVAGVFRELVRSGGVGVQGRCAGG